MTSLNSNDSGDSNTQQNYSLLKCINSGHRFAREYITDSGVLLLREARKNNVDKVVDLLCRGAPFIADNTGVSPLHYAAYNGSIEITELLLNGGMLRDLKNKVDRTPLHIAAQKNHVNIVKSLLTYGADPNVVDMLNMTPLHWAVENCNLECVKLLIKYGANTTTVDNFGRSPLEIATEKNFEDVIYVLENKEKIFQMPKNPKENEDMVVEENKVESVEIEYENSEETHKSEDSVILETQTSEFSSNNSSQQNIELPSSEGSTVTQKDPEPETPSSTSKSSDFFKILQKKDKETLDLLKQIQLQIQMLESDKATTVHSAVQSGQKVVLTEAGKLALNTISKNKITKKPNSTAVVIQNGGKSIKINTGRLTSLDLEKSKPLLKKVGPSHSIRYFEGKQYSEHEDEELKAKLQFQINKLRQEGKLLDIFAKRKFRQANIYNQQLLSLLYLKKKHPNFTAVPE